ncbi:MULTISPECIES: ABC transporter permease [Dactylosporangium]|uniref:Transport permease protein n=2 Tax=Dactylosporangium TaxID=35753 RepID=A0A9W6KL87_9ACTN|nr:MULTISPECIES: ABC transporter permease [Dactylosporangium]UAB95259.1 ABC transporter permease [Dactylosporangium vinaceum]UWZ43586.1 ABC transporter permease [Dactylosporangium matsuzakiense]GLL04081.1 transport permease protein [Dactylosporangium matsuzakiense]
MTTTTTQPSTGEDAQFIAAVPPRPFGLVRHSLVMARRSLIKTMRTPEQLLDVTLQPIIFIVLFVYLLGGAIAGDRHAYMQFLLPALMVQNVLFASAPTGVSLNTDIKNGVFDRFRSLPISRSAPLIGGVLGDMIRFVVSIAVMIGVGYALGFRVETSFLEVVAACLLVMFMAFCFSWMFVLLGMIVREPGAVQGLGFVIMFPLTFGTNVLVPTNTLPGWLQAWVKVNPVADAMEAARALMVGQGEVGTPVLKTFLWSLAILAVFAPLAVRAYRRKA